MAVEKLVLKLEIDAKQFTAAMRKADGTLQKFDMGVRKASTAVSRYEARQRGMSEAFRATVVSLSSLQTLFYQYAFFLGGFVTSVIKINAEYERMKQLLTNLSKETTAAKKAMEADRNQQYIWNLAENAPFSLQSLTDAFVKLKAAGIEPTKGSLTALTDSVAAFGGSSDQLKRASVAIQQMAGKGVISMEELRQQLGESVPDAMFLMARSMRMTMADFVKAVSNGRVVAKPALQKMFDEFKRVHQGSAESMMNTWNGLIARMVTAYSKFVISINKDNPDGLFKTLKTAIQELTDYLNTPFGKGFANDLDEALARIAQGIVDLIKFVYKWRDEITTAAKIFFTLWAGKFVLGTIKNAALAFGVLATRVDLLWTATGTGARMLPRVITLVKTLTSAILSGAIAQSRFGLKTLLLAKNLGLMNKASVVSVANIAKMTLRTVSVIGVFVTLAAVVMKVAHAFRAKAEAEARAAEISKAIRRGEAVDEETLKKQRERAAEIRQEIATLQSEKLQSDAKFGKSVARDSAYNNDIKKLKAELSTVNESVALAQKSIADADAVLEKNNFASKIENQISDKIEKIRTAYTNGVAKLEEDRDKLVKVGRFSEEDEKKFNGSLDKLATERSQNLINTYETAINHLIALKKNYHDAGDKVLEEAAQQKINDLREQQQSEREMLGRLDDPNVFQDGRGDADGKFKGLRNQLVNVRVKAAELRAELHGVQDEFETWDTEEFERKNASLISSEEALRKAIADTKDAIRETKRELQLKGALGDLDSEIASQAQEARIALHDYQSELNSIALQTDKYVEKLLDKNKEVLASIRPEETIEFFDKIYKAASEKQKQVLLAAAEQVKDANEDIKLSLMTQDQAREYLYQREVERVRALIAVAEQGSAEQKTIANDLYAYLDNLARRNEIAKNGPLAEWALQAQSTREQINQSFTGLLDGFISDLAAGKASFKDFSKSLLVELARIIIRAVIAKAILSGLGLGGGGAGSFENPNAYGIATSSDPGIYHKGGIAGKPTGMSRPVDPRMFAFAERFHSGGFPGLKQNEIPIIVEKGEGVFTPEQMKAMAGKQSPTPNIEINVINQTGTNADVHQMPPKFDGEKWVQDIVLKSISRPGPMRDALMAGRK